MTRRSRLALAAILLLGAAVRLWGIGFGLPYTQARPDETFVIGVALSFLRGNFSPNFYDYPWLYMWALTLLYLAYFVVGAALGLFHSLSDFIASWSTHWAPFFLLSRLLSAACGTATVGIVFVIGRRLGDEATGLVAALFLSLAFIHVRDSHFGTTDVGMTFLVMVAMLRLMEAHAGHTRSFASAGFSAGLAAATKYTAGLLVVPAIVSQVVALASAPGPRIRALDRRLLLFGAGFTLAFLVGIPFVFLDTHRFLQAMDLLKQSTTVGQGPATESGWIHHLRLSLRYGMGLPLLVAGLAGAIALLVRTPRIGLVLFAFPAAYYAVAASVKNMFFRYSIPVVPFLCLAAAWLVCRATSRWRPASWVVAILLVAPSALSVVQFDHLIAQADNRLVVARWFAAHVPPGSSVLQSGSQYGHAQLDPGAGYSLWLWDRVHLIFTVNNQRATGQPDWIVLQDSPLPSATQPIVTDFLQHDYVVVQTFEAVSLSDDHLYDQQDAFFVPFAGFKGVRRPGPNFTVYKRAGVPMR